MSNAKLKYASVRTEMKLKLKLKHVPLILQYLKPDPEKYEIRSD